MTDVAVETQATTDAGAAEPTTPVADEQVAEQIGEQWAASQAERGLEQGWTGREGSENDTGGDTPNAGPVWTDERLREVGEQLGVSEEEATELADFLASRPDLDLGTATSAEDYQRQVSLLRQVKAGADAADELEWANAQLSEYATEDFARQAADLGEAEPEQAPSLVLDLLRAGVDPQSEQVQQLVAAGDPIYGYGATLGWARQQVAAEQAAAFQAAQAAEFQAQQATVNAAWQEATARDQHVADMRQQAVELMAEHPDAARLGPLVAEVIEANPGLLDGKLDDPAATRGELDRLFGEAARQVAEHEIGNSIITPRLDSRGRDENGNVWQPPELELDLSRFAPTPTAEQQAEAVLADIQREWFDEPAARSLHAGWVGRGAPEAQPASPAPASQSPSAEEQVLASFDAQAEARQARSLQAGWTGRESRRAARR